MNAPKIEVILRETEPNDAAGLVLLARESLSSEWTEPFVQWKYFQNPAGRIHGCCAETDGDVVGFYGNAPLRIKVGDQILAGTQALDAMVSANVRRQGLFVRLGTRVHAQMASAGVKLSYGIPNPISRSGLVKHMGWHYVGEIPRHVRVLNSTALVQHSGLQGAKALAYRLILRATLLAHMRRTRQLDTGIRVREVDGIDARFDDLWSQASPAFPIAVVRDQDYLTWRYVDNPLVSYTILVAERGDLLRGYLVLSHRDISKGAMAVAELLVSPGDESAGSALLDKAIAYARQADAAQLHCWMLSQHAFYTGLLQMSGFIFSQRRCLPRLFRYTTSLIVKLVPENSPGPDPRKLDNWYMTMGDQDYY